MRKPSRRSASAAADLYAAAEMRREEPTAAEAAFARILDELGNGALKGEYKREWPAGRWLIDFYFPALRLAIEIDGGYHRAPSRWRRDLVKTAELEAMGLTVLRLTNAEVLGDREHLLSRLREAWRRAQWQARASRHGAREPAAWYGPAASGWAGWFTAPA